MTTTEQDLLTAITAYINQRIDERVSAAIRQRFAALLAQPIGDLGKEPTAPSPPAAAPKRMGRPPKAKPTPASAAPIVVKTAPPLSTTFAMTPKGQRATAEDVHARGVAMIEAIRKHNGVVTGAQLNEEMETMMAPGTYRVMRERLVQAKVIKKHGDKSQTTWQLDEVKAAKWSVGIAATGHVSNGIAAHAPN